MSQGYDVNERDNSPRITCQEDYDIYSKNHAYITNEYKPRCAHWDGIGWNCHNPVTHVTTGNPQILDDYADGLDVYIGLSSIGHFYCVNHIPEHESNNALPVTIIDADSTRQAMLECLPYMDNKVARFIAFCLMSSH